MSSISDLLDDDEYGITEIHYDLESIQRLNFDTLTEILVNRDLSASSREEICEKYIREDSLTLIECISNVFSLYLENHLTYLRDSIIHFSKMSCLPFPVRIKAANTLVENDEEVPDVFEHNASYNISLRFYICSDVIERPYDPEFNHTLLFEVLVDLMVHEVYRDRVWSLMTRILTSGFLEESYRFTLFQYLKKKYMEDSNDLHQVLRQGFEQLCIDCLESFEQATRVVLLAQLIPVDKLRFERLRDLIRTDADAAEICDFLLEEKIPEDWRTFAKERLHQIKGVTKNVFESSQNLHEVSTDIEGFVEKMMEFDTTSSAGLIMRFPHLEAVIQRIVLDNNLYSKKAMSICTLMGKCWTCIQKHPDRAELEKRFEQELEDMRETCTSGHLVRLMNVFSGWMEGIRLDIKLEIQSVVFYRLRKMIETLTEEEREQVMEELGSIQPERVDGVAQQSIQDHLFKKIAELHDEMMKDYHGLIDPQKFAEYFRGSLIDFTVEMSN